MKPTSSRSRHASNGKVVDWLLESNQPSVQYYTLVDLLGKTDNDSEVNAARERISRAGWANDLLATQQPEGYWESHSPRTVREWINFLRFPVFQSSVWKGIVLSELGMTATDSRVQRLADRIFEHLLPLSSPVNIFTEEVCIVGNVAGMMTRFGYGNDRRVRKLYDWMIEDQREDGGWNCAAGKPGTLDSWEALAALATIPKSERTAPMERAIARGTEFYLERKLFEDGRRYAPWFRFHFPTHYYYDLLVGLDVLTRLGSAGDRRLRPALQVLHEKRRSGGTWLMDRIHPDEVPDIGRGPGSRRAKPLALERAGQPSLWITLTALRVLTRVEAAG